MSLTSVLLEFKENWKIENVMITSKRVEKKFTISVYWLEKYIDVNK